jgi:hypothetical protein
MKRWCDSTIPPLLPRFVVSDILPKYPAHTLTGACELKARLRRFGGFGGRLQTRGNG